MEEKTIEKLFRERAHELAGQLTTEEKLGMLSTHQHAVDRLGIGEFWIGTEVARGFVGRDDGHISTVFPQPVGLAAAFDRELMQQIGAIAGDECRAYYNEGGRKSNLCVWGPTVDMERDPRWGRTEEAYGEDVFLAGEMTAAYTRGLAGYDERYYKTVPTLKHFCANNNELNRMTDNSVLPLRLKYEYYYAAFMNAIRYGKARSVMTAYNEINGIPALCNPEIKSILKEKWGLWFAVTDGGDLSQTATAHRYHDRHSEVLAEAVRAGCTVMTDEDGLVHNAAKQALSDGEMTEEELTAAAEDVLYARLRLGLLSDDCPYDGIGMDAVDTERSRETNLNAALEQLVLLKNDGTLPLKRADRTAVLGPLSDVVLRDWYTGTFSYCVTPAEGLRRRMPDTEMITDSLWDIVVIRDSKGRYLGISEDGTARLVSGRENAEELELQNWGGNWNNLYSPRLGRYLTFGDNTLKTGKSSIYDWFTRETLNIIIPDSTKPGEVIVEEYLSHSRMYARDSGDIGFTQSRTLQPETLFTVETVSLGRERAAEIAGRCDSLIYCTGNHPVQAAKECFDRKTLRLDIQEGMALYLHSIMPSAVLVLISSYPYAIVQENESLPAILWSSHAGAELGNALAAALTGEYSPSGRLPLTWYRSELELPDIKDYDIEKNGVTYMYFRGKPLYPFGFGLSYAQFRYDSISACTGSGGMPEAVIRLTNISGTDSDEVVQLYFSVPDSAVSRPVRKLCGFERVHLRAGECREIRISVPEHILQIYDTHSGKMITEAGKYVLEAGGSSASLPLRTEVYLAGESIGHRTGSPDILSYDRSYGISIGWSWELKSHYIEPSGWTGTAVYCGVPFAGRSSLTIKAGALMGRSRAVVSFGESTAELEIEPTDSKGSCREYIIPLPEGLPEYGELSLELHDHAMIFGAELI